MKLIYRRKTYLKLILGALILFFCNCSSDGPKLFSAISSSKSQVVFNNRIVENDSINILEEEYVFNGGGVIAADFDKDGLRDLFFTGNQVPNQIYRNLGNMVFENQSEAAQIEAADLWATGATYADVNGDGYLDIYVCGAMYRANRKNKLFINKGPQADGKIRFEESAARYGIDDAGNSMGAVFFDYDRDGFLDLYVLNNEQSKVLPLTYRKKVTDGSAPSNDKLYRNNGNGTFTDVSKSAGITIEGFGLGVGIIDINQDQWPDIYIANDYITNDLLYVNNGDGTFTNKAADLLKHQSMFSMGVDVADFNNDGYKDIVSLDMLGESNYRKKTTISYSNYEKVILDRKWNYETQHSRNMLHLGNGNQQPLSEIGMLSGIYQTDWSWAPLFFDADNDGNKDLFITNGFPRDITDKDFADFRQSVSRFVDSDILLDCIPIVKQKNYAYRNLGNLAFDDKSDDWGIGIPSFSNGAVFSDLDNDGDLDYVVNNINDLAFVFENTTDSQKNHFLQLTLVGPKNNPTGIGTQVVLRNSEKNSAFQSHTNYHTRGYMSGVDDRIHFGLGAKDSVARIEVLWPDGHYQKIENIAANQHLTIHHKAAEPIAASQLEFPFVSQTDIPPSFIAIQDSIGLTYTHIQQDKADFHIQRLLPRKLSENNPQIVTLDANGDGLDDFVISGSDGASPILFTQDKLGNFEPAPLLQKPVAKNSTLDGMTALDIDGDQDKDLLIIQNINDFRNNQYTAEILVLLNDGKGKFRQENNRFPKLDSQLQNLTVIDLNADGQADVFASGKTKIQSYPFPDRSIYFENQEGQFTDKTAIVFGDTLPKGAIQTAIATDFNQDNNMDLIVGSPFEPLQFFMNQEGKLVLEVVTELSKTRGWWQSITEMDIEQDGDPDYIIGNLGQNNPFNISEETPLRMVVNDLDSNGFMEPLLFSYNKDPEGNFKEYPFTFWGNLNRQSPFFRKKFNTYKGFALADIETLLSKEEREASTEMTINDDKSYLLRNQGENGWQMHALPIEAQWAPIYGATQLKKEKQSEILLVGNDYGNEPFYGPMDAFSGVHLRSEKNQLKVVSKAHSQFEVPGNARDIKNIRTQDGSRLVLVAQNNGKLLAFKQNN